MRADLMLPMLCIPEKKTKSVDLCGPLLLDISQKNPEREAQDLEYDLQTLNKYRSQLAKPPKKSSLTARLGHLQSYFRALCRIRTLFPSPKDQINNLAFTWYDAFKQNEKASQQNIHLEKAAVLFNLGAVYSQMGKNRDRSTVEEQRQAAKEFRLAAGAFAYLKDTVATEASMGESTTVDVSVECAGMLEKLMLAQAQECWFEIAVTKAKSPGACEMISRQVALYYEEALAALKATPLKGHVDQKWKPYLQLKAALFNAEACYRHGLKLHEEDGLDEETAWLNSGISTLSEAKKSRKVRLALFLGLSTKIKKISDAIEKLEANMNRSLTMAKKDTGYTGRVSSAVSLSSLQPHSMVEQPISIDEVLGASNENVFASLIPHSSAKALSMYGELVRGVIQTHEIKLQLCSELIRTRLEEMDLPDYTLTLEGQLTLPANLKEVVETLQISGGLAALEAELVQLGNLRRVTQELVVQTEKHLQSKPQSSTQSNNLQDRFNRITDNLKQGAETDAEIECLMKYRSTLMSILDRQPIESALPIISLDANEDAIVGALKKSLGKLKTLSAQGERLPQDLKHMYRKDDIQLKLSASTSSQEDLFKKEISKYDRTCKEIDQNIEAREQLLSNIQAQNDQLSSFPNLEKNKASRQKFYGEIRAAIPLYQEIKENINQAKNFYMAVQKTVKNVKRQCGEFQGPKMNGLESDVYGQAASDLVAGSDSEGAILGILEMGGGTWDRGTVVHALRAARNNPNRAVEYLYSGIPEQAEIPPAARVPPSAQAANPPAQPVQPAQPASGQLPSAMPQAVTFMPEERKAMERLEAMGFDRESVRKVYLACNKNEELIANYLLDHIHEYED